MGKRSDFARITRDFYPTPKKAFLPLIPYLPRTEFKWIEPCAGDGALFRHMQMNVPVSRCVDMLDIDPGHPSIRQMSAFHYTRHLAQDKSADMIITNPPFQWKTLDPMISHFRSIVEVTWLLLPFTYAANVRFGKHMDFCLDIVPIGRVKWFSESKNSGTEDFAWYKFTSTPVQNTTLHKRMKL